MRITMLLILSGVLLVLRLVLARRSSPYTLIERVVLPWGPACVRETSEFRELVFEKSGLVQTRATRTGKVRSRLLYTNVFHMAAALGPRTGRALFIGGGGGVVPREFDEEYGFACIDVVELCPEVLSLASRHFGLNDGARLRLHCADGVEFLQGSGDSFELVVVDAFQNDDTPPREILAPDVLRGIRARLTSDGVACFNICGRPLGAAVKELNAALRAVFGPRSVVRVDVMRRVPWLRLGWRRRNMVFLVARSAELLDRNWDELAQRVPVAFRESVQDAAGALRVLPA